MLQVRASVFVSYHGVENTEYRETRGTFRAPRRKYVYSERVVVRSLDRLEKRRRTKSKLPGENPIGRRTTKHRITDVIAVRVFSLSLRQNLKKKKTSE